MPDLPHRQVAALASSTTLPALLTPTSGSRRLAGVEGLRALAALSILLLHAWSEGSGSTPPSLGARLDQRLPDLSYGVTLFFTLSGFLLYRPFSAVLLTGGSRLRVGRYLRHRALRIFPAYWTVLLVCGLGLGGLLHRSGSTLVEGRLTQPGLLLKAAFLVQDYDPRTVLTGIGPAWTLAVEAMFYLVLPLLVWLAWRVGRGCTGRSRMVLALAPPALLLGLGLVGKVVTGRMMTAGRATDGWETNWQSVLERSFFCQADLFSFGMALAVLHNLQQAGCLHLPRLWRVIAWTGAFGGYLVSAKTGPYDGQLGHAPQNTLMAVACTCLLALVVLGEPRRSALVRLLEARPLVWTGTLSYSIFLWHHPLLLTARRHGLTSDGRTGLLLNVLLLLLVTLALSFFTYRWVEVRALKLGARRQTVVAAQPTQDHIERGGGDRRESRPPA